MEIDKLPAPTEKGIYSWLIPDNAADVIAILMILGGGASFYFASGDQKIFLRTSFAVLVSGLILRFASYCYKQRQNVKTRVANLIKPGNGWRFVGRDSMEGEYCGLPVRIRYQNQEIISFRNQTQKIPALMSIRFSLPEASDIKLALNQHGPWDGLAHIYDMLTLSKIESISLGGLDIHGRPSEKVEKLLSLWIRDGFMDWKNTIKNKFGLSLISLRMHDSTFEFNFRGWLLEPSPGQGPLLKDKLNELLRDCHRWIFLSSRPI
jgi:hypothetical protein